LTEGARRDAAREAGQNNYFPWIWLPGSLAFCRQPL